VPVKVADVKMRARRPQYCALSNRKLGEASGYSMPSWQDALKRYLYSLHADPSIGNLSST
jgi:dTDP-4-dehydrorhamnose reductase